MHSTRSMTSPPPQALRSVASSLRPHLHLAWRCVPLAVLVACGGGGGSDKDADAGTGASGDTVAVNGVLVVPSTATVTEPTTPATPASSRAPAPTPGAASASCPDVPEGYDPLANVQVDFKNLKGEVVFKLMTNACGQFSGAVPKAATTAEATTEATGPISQPVATLTQPKPTVVSCMPKDAKFVISVIQYLGADKIALSVTDSVTNKAVLGLTTEDFSFTYNEANSAVETVSYGSEGARKPARVGVVLDSSGSMNEGVGDTGKNRIQVAALAAHQLLNGLAAGSDEVGTVVFGKDVKVINDEVLGKISWVDANGAAAPNYTFSNTGLTSNIKSVRPLIDIYNRKSKIHIENRADASADAVHPDSGALGIAKALGDAYGVGGETAFYKGVSAGLTLLDGDKAAADSEESKRRIVVSLTDGRNTVGDGVGLDTVIGQAKEKKVPLYAVAFGSAKEVDEPNMQRMAKETGGEYKRVENLDLTSLFQGIQTGIRFQYLADMNTAPARGTLIRASVKRGSTTATRELMVP